MRGRAVGKGKKVHWSANEAHCLVVLVHALEIEQLSFWVCFDHHVLPECDAESAWRSGSVDRMDLGEALCGSWSTTQCNISWRESLDAVPLRECLN